MGCKISLPKKSESTSNGSIFQRNRVKKSQETYPLLLSYTKVSNDLNFSILDPAPSVDNHQNEDPSLLCSNICSSSTDISLPNDSSSLSVATAIPSPIYFEGPVHQQYFAFPDSLIYYIAMNQTCARLYQKMIQSCKYFFAVNPVIVVSCVRFGKNGILQTCLINKDGYAKFDLHKITAKLWFCDKLHREKKCQDLVLKPGEDAGKPYPMDLYISKLYRYENNCGVSIYQRTLTFDQLLIFANTQALTLDETIITHEDGSSVQLETIIVNFPRLEQIDFTVDPNSSDFSRNTVTELLKIPHFAQMKKFVLRGVPDTFDIETFYKHLKERDDLQCGIQFCSTISNEYFARLEVIVDELLAFPEPTYFRFPYLKLPNLNTDKQIEMFRRYDKDFDRRAS